MRVSEVDFHLFQSTASQKTGGAADERNFAAVRKAGADADHVLLGDPDIHHPLRPPLAEVPELTRADAIVDDGDDSVIVFCEFFQRL